MVLHCTTCSVQAEGCFVRNSVGFRNSRGVLLSLARCDKFFAQSSPALDSIPSFLKSGSMFTNNPYAQGGWYNPENPLSINNGTWGGQSPPQPSVYGALPTASSPSPPKILTFFFVSFNPTILNSTVVGPQSKKYFDVVTNSPNVGASTVFRKAGQPFAAIEWITQPAVEIYGVVPPQTAARWLELSRDQTYRSMQFGGKWYAWVHKDKTISLFTVGPSPPELLARVSREPDTVKLELTAQAVQAGLLEAAVVATVLLQSGRNFG
ncbi:hypothetical protein D9615_002128 [Tricholomella constricta]|uniref:DUF6593 domain-containing protein n=1 Tax=Tricholomella constricta TaxID=117010 RepID=A0A8H5MAK4_9AGAR|nr:hypothetical protein D9615_002128 [Tricholomella constricta]